MTELLAERERVVLSRSTVRRLLVGAGLSSSASPTSAPSVSAQAHAPGRDAGAGGRQPPRLAGRARGPWFTLLLAVDDATGQVPYALFREKEDTQGYLLLLKGIIQRRGIPLALYSDRYIVFRHPSTADETAEAPLANNGKPTQFGRAMRELGVTQVFARSPEAKGRVERANGTFQDRLVSELRLAGASTLEEANNVLEQFLLRFNERFGVPAAQPEPAYRPIDPGLDTDAVLCIKDRRRVAKDNTVQYHGQTLQLFPGTDRPSYARAYVEVQERLDGRLLVNCHGKLLTPVEAPPLAATLRAFAATSPMDRYSTMQADMDISAPVSQEHAEATKQCVGLGWDGDWYQDDSKKCIHRDIVKAGMERARQQGKRIGRPKVTERPEFLQRFASIVESIGPTGLSRRQTAKELAIGYATLKRLLDAQLPPAGQCASGSPMPAVRKCRDNANMYAEVLY